MNPNLFQLSGNMLSSATRSELVNEFAQTSSSKHPPTDRMLEIGGDDAEAAARRITKDKKPLR
ncbi:MAG TPA: hypothetical protein VGU66_09085 [Candidatus Elarobacter sp.]|nr:hypothetical protein [Candidatus Elarobacter sp.]